MKVERIGDRLISKGVISPEQLEFALNVCLAVVVLTVALGDLHAAVSDDGIIQQEVTRYGEPGSGN